MAADTRVLLARGVVLAAVTNPNKEPRLPIALLDFSIRIPEDMDANSVSRQTHLQPEACWPSEVGAPMGESGTTACPGLWMVMPGICCHVEGMRICCVPAGQPCCAFTHV